MFYGRTTLPLRPEQLKVLECHKYSCNGSSYFEPIYQAFWCFLVPYIPKKIAPNTLTLTGLIINVVCAGIILFHSSDFKSEIPPWSLILGIIGLFTYQTLDALDGKHARQTNTSSPLGELFDHGCDSLASVIILLTLAAAVGLGDYPVILFLQFFLFLLLFYIVHWQCYITGFLAFGKVDVTEGEFSIMLVMLASAIFGVKFWDNVFPIIRLPFKLLPTLIMSISAIDNFKRFLSVILKGGAGKSGTTVANTSVLFPIFPFGLVLLMALMVAFRSPMGLYSNNILLFLISFGLVACKIIMKLVINHMCKSEMTLFDSILIGPFLLLLNQYFNCPIPEVFVLWCCCLWAATDIFIFCQQVCLQIANHLNIYVFRVDKPPPKLVNNAQASVSPMQTRSQWKQNKSRAS